MSSPHPHWLRSAIIAGVGLAVALVSILWVGTALRSVGPQTISLAYRIDRKELLAFVRTTDEGRFRNAIRTANRFFPEQKLQSIPELPKGVSYEYALMTGSGTKSWIVLVHRRNQQQTILESSEHAVKMLTINRIKDSLGASAFFRTQGGKNISDCMFIALQGTTILSPFSGVLQTFDKKNGAMLTLEKKDHSLPLLSGTAPAAIDIGTDPLFSVSIAHPRELPKALQGTGNPQNSKLLEGLRGILQYRLETLTHRSDLEEALEDLGQNGLSVSIFQDEEDQSMLLQMEGKNAKIIDQWLERIRSAGAPAIIRTQKFLHGNTRTDVIAAPIEGNLNTENGWTLLSSNSGSTQSVSIATKATTMLLSNDHSLLRNAMSTANEPKGDLQQTKASIAGTTSTDWLVKTLGAEGTALQSILGTGTRITWEARDEGDTVIIRYWVK